MRLTELIQAVNPVSVLGDPHVEISGIANHSGRVEPGSLFICISGYKCDGHGFAHAAYERGAVAVVTERILDTPLPQVLVRDSRLAQAQISQAFYQTPSRRLSLVGVTGTNGKTTITYLTEAILKAVGLRTGLIGTIGYRIGDWMIPATHTTPDSLELGAILHQMVQSQVQAAVMEVSSQALALDRVTGSDFEVVVFSNISRDHFEFHANINDYVRAKARLFSQQCTWGDGPRDGYYAVINADDRYAPYFMDAAQAPNLLTYGLGEGADLRAFDWTLHRTHSTFRLALGGEILPIYLPIPGLFNIYNALAAVASCHCLGVDSETIRYALASFRGVPGRYEFIDCGQDFDVIVDFAHNPSGLRNILSLPARRRILVFGCEGGKDRGKRSLMGRVAARHADHSIITSDNPFNEEPLRIIGDIEKGFLQAKSPNYELIPDRDQAIEQALQMACPGDTVIIAGKGHETRTIMRERVIPSDDRQTVRQLLDADHYNRYAKTAQNR